ncbi:MAG: ATP-binding protein [Planctomycetes bacterium]|nr:ATP-binding protein [Planctomycetota bacterium]
MENYEKQGSFYLGRQHDLSSGKTGSKLTLYDSKDLTTHAVCVGMTGSGKTGLCLSLIEEAGLDGIPVIAIDPKGDLGNLLLTFPELQSSDFRPWVDPSTAARKGMSPDEFAEKTATMWRDGLADWGQDGERIRRYNEQVDKAIYTPGSSAGIPLTVLKSFRAPPQAVIDDSDAYRDYVQSTTSGVLALLGIDADPVRSREHIFLSNVLDRTWRAGRDLDLASLIHEIQNPPFSKVGVVDLETFFSAKDRLELGMQLNNLLASPSFASWLEGDPLDIQKLFYTDEGRPRLSILSIAHLNDTERMFFVTILLNEILSWMRSQPGTGSLRAILYMDEVFGYFPPTANPPSKRPMLTLLKQARAYGLGVVLATQNPVDLDYKGLSNAGTWFLGRLQTERDKARVLEGLEGASAQAGANFDRGKMEATLAALGSRVFLMNNVHSNQPEVFHTRWAMSYLRGPLTRDQIRTLMAGRKALAAERAEKEPSPSGPEKAESAKPATPTSPPVSVEHARPVISADVRQKFWPLAEPIAADATLEYRPALLGESKLHFVRASMDVDTWQDLVVLQPVHGELPDPVWEASHGYEQTPPLDNEPCAGARFADLVSPLAQAKNYKRWDDDLKKHLYRTEKLTVWECKALDQNSEPGESEGDFRIRITQLAREKRDEAKAAVREKYKKRLDRAEESVRKAEGYASEQRSQFWTRVLGVLWMIVEVALGMMAGGKGKRRFSTTSASQAMRERGEQTRAEQKLALKQEALQELQKECEEQIERIELDFDPKNLDLECEEIAPRKSDTAIDPIVLVWLPWQIDSDGAAQVAY